MKQHIKSSTNRFKYMNLTEIGSRYSSAMGGFTEYTVPSLSIVFYADPRGSWGGVTYKGLLRVVYA